MSQHWIKSYYIPIPTREALKRLMSLCFQEEKAENYWQKMTEPITTFELLTSLNLAVSKEPISIKHDSCLPRICF